MRMGMNPAGQAITGKTFGGYVQPPLSAVSGVPASYAPRWGGPADCKAYEDEIARLFAAYQAERSPFTKNVIFGLATGVRDRAQAAGCYLPFGFGGRYESVDTWRQPSISDYGVAPNNAAVTLNPKFLVKAAGQVMSGEASSAGSAIVGLAMIGGAFAGGYYLGKRAKKKARR